MKWITGLGFFLFLSVCHAAPDVAPYGIHIGDDAAKLHAMAFKLTGSGGSEHDKWETYLLPDGNKMWITLMSGKVAYVDEEWNKSPESTHSFMADASFGKGDYRTIRQALTQSGFKYVYRAYSPAPGDYPDLYDCYADTSDPDRFVMLKAWTSPFNYRPGMRLDDLPYDLRMVAVSSREGIIAPDGGNPCDPNKVLIPALPLKLSDKLTDTPYFTIRLPEGFPAIDLEARLPGTGIKNSGPGYADYVYSPDPSPKAWIPFIQISFVWLTAGGTNGVEHSLALPALMYGASRSKEKEPNVPHRTLSGIDFECQDWSDPNGGTPYTGYLCVGPLKEKKGMIVVFIEDNDEPYQAREAVYKAVVDSIRFKSGVPGL